MANAPAEAYSKRNCIPIYNTLRAIGATKSQANYLGHKIAWRESGCSLQCVSDHDDHSCSRFGLNFKGKMGQFWGKLCGAWTRNATRILKVDARCALKALRLLGTKPWR